LSQPENEPRLLEVRNCEHSYDKVDLKKRTSGTTYSDKSSNSEVYPHMAASA